MSKLRVKSYKKQDGNTYYKFQTYLGVDEAGKPVRASRSGFTTREEAQKKAIELKNEFQNDSYIKPKHETFRDVYEVWFKTRYEPDVRESTAFKTNQIFNNHILTTFGDKQIQNITPIDCTRAVDHWNSKIKKARVLKNYTSRVFDFAINMMIINHNPMDKVQMPKYRGNSEREINFYTKEELETFLECCKQEQNPKWFPLFRLLAFSGMRKGEALGLQWRKVDFENNTITVDQSLSSGKNNHLLIQQPKTKSGIREIPMDKPTMDILKEWRKTQMREFLKLGINTNTPEQYVFTNNNNEFMNHSMVTKRINDIIKKHNLKKITTHELRHTHASLLFEAGVSIKDVQERLGHSSYEITMNIYTHINKERKVDTADVFAQYVGF